MELYSSPLDLSERNAGALTIKDVGPLVQIFTFRSPGRRVCQF